jgi:hypothetical protein
MSDEDLLSWKSLIHCFLLKASLSARLCPLTPHHLKPSFGEWERRGGKVLKIVNSIALAFILPIMRGGSEDHDDWIWACTHLSSQ